MEKTVNFHLQTDWLPLVGQDVEVRLHGETLRQGTVDAVTLDNSILWLAAEGEHGRAMWERAEGYTVWVRYKWEKP